MKTLISFVIYALIFLAIGALLYFVLFWRPTQNRVQALNRDIITAQAELIVARDRDDTSAQIQQDIDRLDGEIVHAQSEKEHAYRIWESQYLDFLPDEFNEQDIHMRIGNIIAPHAGSYHIYYVHTMPFGVITHNDNNPNGPPEGIWLTQINVSFSASYNSLIEILSGIAREDIDNRVVEYTLHRNGSLWDVVLRVDMLTRAPGSGGHSYGEPSG